MNMRVRNSVTGLGLSLPLCLYYCLEIPSEFAFTVIRFYQIHACAKSVLKFTFKVVGRADEEPAVRSFINQEITPRAFHQVL